MPGVNGERVPCFIPYGSKGSTVRVLQRFLNGSDAAGPAVKVDGSYGPATRTKIKAYQREWNGYPCADKRAIRYIRLTVDGNWGPQTSKVSQHQLPGGACGD